MSTGYSIVAASAVEVGLVKNGKGVRTWWASDFNGKLPDMNHPKVQEAIAINEAAEKAKEDYERGENLTDTAV